MKTRSLLFCALILFFSSVAFSQNTTDTKIPKASLIRPPGTVPVRTEKLSAAALEGYGERFSYSTGNVYHCDWSPDGNWIAYEDNGDIFVKSVSGGEPVNMTADIDGFCYLPYFTPDNSGVAFTVYDYSLAKDYIVFADLSGAIKTVMIDNAHGAVWSHNGRYVVYRDYTTSDLRVYDYQTQQTKIVAPGDYIATADVGYGASCFSNDDTTIITSMVVDGFQRLFMMNVDGSNKKQLTFNGGHHDYPDLSPDGKWLLFTTIVPTSIYDEYHQWALNLETAQSFPLFSDPSVDTFMGRFSESPDRYCYITNVEGVYEVYTKDFVEPSVVVPEVTLTGIPRGTFQMGDVDGVGDSDEKPVHTVTITAFEMSAYEVTNAQYASYLNDALSDGAIIASSASVKGATGDYVSKEYITLSGTTTYANNECKIVFANGVFTVKAGYESWPVTWVTWFGAKAYAQYYGFDLPREGEWEYACRGGKQFRYGTDDGTISATKANYSKSNIIHPVDVGDYPPNPFGLYDMSGNVWEWCADWYGSYTSGIALNPSGPATGSTRVIRGGGWAPDADGWMSSNRDGYNPASGSGNIGFRVVQRTVLPAASLKLLAPNGGEVLIAGKTILVKWEAQGLTLAKLEYSPDNGTTWTVIAENLDATSGQYSWQVPAAETTQGLVRVQSKQTDGTTIGDRSDAVFTIVVPYLRVSAPNGGEEWSIGKTYIITWEARNVETIKLDYSIDGGTTWKSLASGVDATKKSFSWTIPNDPSANCKVRITDESGSGATSSTYAKFSILQETANPYLRIVSPNGGEEWEAGSTQVITWEARNVDTAKLELSRDGGSTWVSIASSVSASTQSYSWMVPTTVSETCRVRISSGTGSTAVSSTSYANFAIVPKQFIKVTSPNGGEVLTPGSMFTITWNFYNIDKFNIQFTSGLGQWTTIVENVDINILETTGTFVWTVPDVESTTCRVRVVDASGSGLMDGSDATFSIAKQNAEMNIIVEAPVAGNVFPVGKSFAIKWQATGIEVFDIEYSLNGGSSWDTIITEFTSAVTSAQPVYSFEWTVPDSPTTQAMIRILNSKDRTYFRQSGLFTIEPQAAEYLTLLYPIGGETVYSGSTIQIKWESAGFEKVDIEYTIDNGDNYQVIVWDHPASSGSLDWTVPQDIDSRECRIWIGDAVGEVLEDESDAFIITPAPYITILGPNGGETLIADQTAYIAWISAGVTTVTLEYSLNGGTSWNVIEENFPASNEGYSWQVPVVESDNAMLRIQGKRNDGGSVSDRSDGSFAIVPSTIESGVVIVSPNGGENWTAGETYDITWQSGGFDDASIWYTADAGDNWDLIVSRVPASQGYYSWTIPEDLDIPECFIAITNSDNVDVFDISDSSLSIVKPAGGSVDLLAPSGGDVLIGGQKYTIKWEAYNVTNMDLYFSIDGFDNHIELIAENVPASNNQFVWTVPSDPFYESANCYIFVTETGTANALGINLSPFAISIKTTGQPIELISPVGGLELDAGTQAEISWTADNTVTAVAIHYSIDSGTSWTLIASRVDASTGSFLWTIPSQAVSGNCIVRVVNVDNLTVSAVSQPFTVMPDPANTNASFALDTDFVRDGVQERPVVGIKPNSRVGFAAYSVNWRTAGSYTVTLKWDASKATFRRALSLLTMKGQQMIINGVTATLPTESNILSADGGTTDYTVLQEDTGVFKARIARTSIGVSRLSEALLYVGIFETTAKFGAGDSLAVNVAISVTDKLGRVTDLTAHLFKVYGEPDVRTLALTSPNGGETLHVGSEQAITWQSDGVADVRIEYSTDNGATWNTVVDRTEALAGSFLWTVPDIQESTQCLIRVADADTEGVTDTSDGVFEIVKQAFIQVTSPAKDTSWKEGSKQTITWTALNIDNVTIEYSTNGGASWSTIASSVSASLNKYDWTIPDGESNDCVVRIRDTGNTELFATSEGVFSITTSDYIIVTAPIARDTWTVNTDKQITWQVKGVQNVSIDVSYDNGETWPDRIADSVSALTGSFTWKVPDSPAAESRIRIVDTTRPEQVYYVTETFVILRPELSIEHTPLVTALENEQIMFSATVKSTADIASVVLYYNQMGQSEGVVSVTMEKSQENIFTYTLPTGVFIAPGIEYYIIADDVNSIEARSPVDVGVYSINARVSGVKSTSTVSGGSEQAAYRLISIPLNTNATSIVGQLSQTLPMGEMGTEWRLFRYPSGASEPQEYPDIEAFAPGKAFWLITTKDFVLTAPDGTTVPTDEPFQMTLKSGWNDIADPWMFSIKWSDIENRSNARLSTLYTYDGKWSDPTTPPTVMEPWKGYAVRNLESSDRIVFLRTSAQADKPATFAGTESWRLSIAAIAGEAMDTANHLGVRTDADIEWDRFDHVEPPGVGDYVSVYFPHEDWSIFPYDYTVDFRPPSTVFSWDFVVKTNIAGETVDVELTGMDSLPSGAAVRLFDRDLNTPVELTGAGFSFVSGKGTTERRFTLEVSDIAEQDPGDAVSKPEQFVTATAFPNPFNPQTTLKYELSEAGVVRIIIFNSLGQKVREYSPGFMEAGVHETVFDAAGLTSGLYMFRVDAGYSSVTGKMLYMK